MEISEGPWEDNQYRNLLAGRQNFGLGNQGMAKLIISESTDR